MPAALCISIDVELAWGIWDKPDRRYHALCAEHERTIVRSLLTLFEEMEVPATWAIVGQLLEPPARNTSGAQPGGPIWHAPDLIELLGTARVPQDIGSHSFAHIYFAQSSRDDVRADLASAREIHDKFGLPFTSFVFPRNQVAHIDLLAAAGVKVFRSVDEGWHMTVRDRLGRQAGRVAHLVDQVLPVTPAVVHPRSHGDLVELPSSMLLMARDGMRRAIAPQAVVLKAKRGLEAAANESGLFHLWFHPSNFYYDPAGQLSTLREIVKVADSMRDRGQLSIRPMSAYANAS